MTSPGHSLRLAKGGGRVSRFNSLQVLVTVRDLTPALAGHPSPGHSLCSLSEGLQRGLSWANGERGCGIVPLSRALTALVERGVAEGLVVGEQ